MSRESMARQWHDEDTQVGFLGHITSQASDQPEQSPDDRIRRQPGQERSPNQENPGRRKEKKRERDSRK